MRSFQRALILGGKSSWEAKIIRGLLGAQDFKARGTGWRPQGPSSISGSRLPEHLFREMLHEKESSSSHKFEKCSFFNPCWGFTMQICTWRMLATVAGDCHVDQTVRFQAAILLSAGQQPPHPYRPVTLRLHCASESPGVLVKTQIAGDTHPLNF